MTTNTNRPAPSKHQAARRRMASFVMAQTGATLDDEATIDFSGNVVLSGAVSECALVGAYFAEVLLVDGVTVEPADPSDPDFADWTCVRIPEAGLQSALAKHAR